MAIAFDASSKNLITTGTAISFTHTPVGTPTLVVASFHMRDDVTNITACTYGGVTMIQAVALDDAVNSLSVEVWYLFSPPGGAQTLAATIDDTGIDTRTYVSSYTGTATAGGLGNVASDDDSESVAITPPGDNHLVYGAIISEEGDVAVVASGENAISTDDEGSWSNAASYIVQTTAAAQTVNWTGPSSESAVVAASFAPYDGATGADVNESCDTDPATGTKAGDTTYISTGGGHLRLIEAASFARGQFDYVGDLGDDFTVSFDFWAGGGTGGEALWFYWGAINSPVEEGTDEDQRAIVFNAFADQVQYRFAGTSINTVAMASIDNSTWRRVRIEVSSADTIKVYVNGTEVMNYTDSSRTLGGTDFGWGARNGGDNNEWRIRNLSLTEGGGSPPATGVSQRMLMGAGI